MGCTQSKRIESSIAADNLYRPAPTSFALFDVNSIEEPWLKGENRDDEEFEKPVNVPTIILEKLDKFEIAPDGPQSWSEVSKALEEIKPTLHNPKPKLTKTESVPVSMSGCDSGQVSPMFKKPLMNKNVSFHTLDELDRAKLSPKSTELKRSAAEVNIFTQPVTGEYKPVKENMFVLRDRLEREKEGKPAFFIRRDPLSEYPEKCPPGGSDSVVLYTTTLRGVRRTFDDCNRARSVIEGNMVVIDERDVSLHGEYLNELKELLGEGVSVPRLFIKGRYIGGVDKVVELNELSRLGRLLNSVGIDRDVGSKTCEGCGGARFVPCLQCGGSCKVVIGDKKDRCAKCNENGLMQCPLCR
ncbi:hypothetical protein GIB67_033421 [Kingdonia uniflora]|uniref:Glutaredoxin domain-containing protein n=1 Tax=Kingdonia uniflora TaxID=39325 RepID=A0A7J7LU45_9MAGN|nr:hypothetical protein GIB67_033421 [Kingdonia uniflora]